MNLKQNRANWEEALVRNAAYFTCSTPDTKTPRPRGQRMQWIVLEYPNLRMAVQVASVDPRSLVYAVTASGDSAPLSRNDWTRYLAMRGE